MLRSETRRCAARSRRCASKRRTATTASASSTSTSIGACRRSRQSPRCVRAAAVRRLASIRLRRPQPACRRSGCRRRARPAGSDQQNYEAAFDLIQARKYDGGGCRVRDVPDAVPDEPACGQRAVLARRDATTCAAVSTTRCPSFGRSSRSYPQSAKVPDALLKVGLLPGRARRSRLRRARRCKRSCASSPTRRPRGSHRSGSTACRSR